MRGKRRLPWLISLLACLLLCTCFGAAAEETASANMALLSEPEVSVRRFGARVRVTFPDPALWQEGLYVSYHVDTVPERRLADDALQFDTGVAIPLVLDADGAADIDLAVDVSAWDEAALYVHYDILDDVNHQWFAYTPGMLSTSAMTVVRYSRLAEAAATLKDAVRENPVFAVVNTLFFVAAIGGVVIVKKKKLLNF